jgi:5-hydroxyisourate hydrolase-like protein (transthyretin family)
MRVNIVTISLVLASGVVASAAMAQQSYRDCALIQDDQERLMCYDRLNEQDKKPVPAAKMKEKVEQKRDNNADFGLEHKKLKQDESMSVELTSRDKDAYGKWILTFDNGQVWKQKGSEDYFPWHDEGNYTITRGMFNAYFLSRKEVNKRMKIERIK